MKGAYYENTLFFNSSEHFLKKDWTNCNTDWKTLLAQFGIGYSFKTNSLPWVLSFMKEHGCYAEVVSENEYELAEYIGFEHIIYNGPVKGKR